MQPQAHWRRLLLRTEAGATKYEADIQANTSKDCPLCLYENVQREFTYWVQMPNKYPYDRYFSKSDMLVLKRHIDEQGLTHEEHEEYYKIRTDVLTDEYDTIMNHLPRQKSIPDHHHVHLIQIRRNDGLPRD